MLESLIGIDENLYMLINSELSNGLLDVILVPFRHKLFWVPLYLFLLSFLLINYKRESAIILLGIVIMMTVSDTVSSKLIKKTVKRTRPCHIEKLHTVERVPCSHGYSFTSSHATNHFAIGMFFFLLLTYFKWRPLFLIWAGVIGFAQIYVGVHYPIDVIVGSIVGALIGLLGFKIYQSLSRWLSINQKQKSIV